MVPEGWKLCRLGEIASVERGKFSARPRNDPKYYGGSIPFVQTGDVGRAGTYLEFHSQTLNKLGLSVSRLFPSNTILLTIAANIGDTVITTYEVACPDSVVGIQVAPDKADFFWLKMVLETHKGRLSNRATQNAQKNINLQTLTPLKIRTPPLSEQKRIAEILSTWDQAIETTEKLIESSKAQKKALMQQLLTGKKHLPGFKDNWIWPRASAVFEPISNRKNSDEELLSVTQDQGVVPRSSLDRKVVMPEGSPTNYKLVVPGDFVISLRSFQGGLEYSRYRGLVSPAYTVLSPIRPISDSFYRHYFKSYEFIGRLAVAVIGIRDGKQVSYGDFSFLQLPYPPKDEQMAVANVLDTAEGEINSLSDQLSNLRRQKKSLMQQLLTGKRRVKVPT